MRRATHYDNYNLHCTEISIHALLAESDPLSFASCLTALLFLSTLSLRRATFDRDQQNGDRPDFYPRSPCGERRFGPGDRQGLGLDFYPRSPCGERLMGGVGTTILPNFYPRSPCGERLLIDLVDSPVAKISIHALLAESDSKSAQNSGALLRIWNKFYGDCIFMLTGKAVFYPFCPCFFHIFWCEGSGNFMIAFPSH